MKTVTDIQAAIERRLQRTWHLDAVGQIASWPFEVSLGGHRTAALTNDFTLVQQQVREVRAWTSLHGLSLRDGNRRVHGTSQPVPTHVIVPGLRAAAAVCGAEWVTRIDRSVQRASVIRAQHPECAHIAGIVRAVDGYTDLDFELLLTVTDWLNANTPRGLTPRQVPVPGVHAKWLNTHGPVIERVLGEPLDLAPRHPARIHFAYLDPEYLEDGRRRFDSATVGDAMEPAYRPEVVIITENKDTAIHFPPTPSAVVVEGAGYGGATIAAFDWIVTATTIVYWGDLDAAGFEILDGFRRDGVPAISILMDIETYRAYAPWGTFHHPNGQPIGTTEAKRLATLTDAERATYHAVCSPGEGMPPRVEQERIPLHLAHAALLEVTAWSHTKRRR